MSLTPDQIVISLLMPTRARPLLAERFIRSAYSRAATPEQLEIIIYSDEDDFGSHNLGLLNDRITLLIGPKVTTGAMYTSCLKKVRGDVVILASDDVVILTDGWDTAVRNIHATYPDGIYIAYPNDLHQKRCTFPIITKHCADLLQNPFPMEYVGAFIDTHLFDIFQRLKQQGFSRVNFLEDVHFEHLHPRAGKAEYDSTYENKPRFSGDVTFLSQINNRSQQALDLVTAVNNGVMLPHVVDNKTYPTNIFFRIRFIFLNVALDRRLPMYWRYKLAAFLTARSIVTIFINLLTQYKFYETNSTKV